MRAKLLAAGTAAVWLDRTEIEGGERMQAATHKSLGDAYWRRCDFDVAMEHYQRATDLFRGLKDGSGESDSTKSDRSNSIAMSNRAAAFYALERRDPGAYESALREAVRRDGRQVSIPNGAYRLPSPITIVMSCGPCTKIQNTYRMMDYVNARTQDAALPL